MNQLILFFTIFSFFLCQSQKKENRYETISKNNSSTFQITFDTLDVSIDGDLRKIVLFRDNYYGMFETNRKNTTQNFKKMIVFNQKEGFVEDVFIPGQIQNMPNYELIVEKDSLYIQDFQFEKTTLILGAYVADFSLTKTKNLKLYQDDFFDIYADCNGEWGGTIFFRDRKTDESFEASSTCPVVINKIGNDYYVTNFMGHMIGFSSVIKISDPRKLEKSSLNFKNKQGSTFSKGVEVLLNEMDFYIPTSFVVDNKLFHLYSDGKGTYIGKIENGKYIPVYKFDFMFNADFNQHLDNGKQLLTCNFKDSKKNVILIIDGNKFKFHMLK